MLRLFTTVLACVAVAPAIMGAPPLLIVSTHSGSANIHLVTADSTGAVNLTDSKSDNRNPAWSADGKKIAFSSNRDGTMGLYVMDADGKNVTQLTTGPYDRVPSWTPDGRTIVFSRTADDSRTRIYSVPAAGGEPRAIGDGDGWDPALSPDGKKIAFASLRGGDGFRLYVMDADGSNVKELTTNPNPSGSVYPAWSPDGKRIAWTDRTGNGLDIHVCDSDGKNAKRLTKLGGLTTYATWSPDGKTIAFHHAVEADKPGAVYLMDADGGNLKVILKNEAHVEGGRPAWKPK